MPVLAVVLTGTAEAQGRSDCRSSQPPSIGAAVGRSSPYLDLAPGTVEAPAAESVVVGGGTQLVGRADLPFRGPLRLRVEGSTATWDVRRRRYDPDDGYRVASETSVGHMTARHLVASIGLRGGRAPVCGHVLAGGGVYSLGLRDTSLRRAGVSLAAGIELPTGAHGAVQADMVLHLIGTRDGHPITRSVVPVANLLVGWAYRF